MNKGDLVLIKSASKPPSSYAYHRFPSELVDTVQELWGSFPYNKEDPDYCYVIRNGSYLYYFKEDELELLYTC